MEQPSMTLEQSPSHPSDILGPLDNLLRFNEPEETDE